MKKVSAPNMVLKPAVFIYLLFASSLQRIQGEVQEAPTKVSLSASDSYFEFDEGMQMGFICSAQGGQPPPRVNLTLDGKVLKSELQSLSWSGEAKYSYSMMKIKCMVLHSALAREMSSGRTITINYRPRLAEKSDVENNTVIYMNASSIENNQATLEVKVKSVPQPHHFIWKQASDGAVLNASNYQPLKQSNAADTYVFDLHVASLSNQPGDVLFLLIVDNNVGSSHFKITLRKYTDKHNNSTTENFNVLILPCLILINFLY